MDKIIYKDNKLTREAAEKLIKREMDEILCDLEDNPISHERSGSEEYSLFSIYNDLLYKGAYYDIYARFSFAKESYEDCRIFLTFYIEKEGTLVYKDTIEENDISALTEYLVEIEELVYRTEKESRKTKRLAA